MQHSCPVQVRGSQDYKDVVTMVFSRLQGGHYTDLIKTPGKCALNILFRFLITGHLILWGEGNSFQRFKCSSGVTTEQLNRCGASQWLADMSVSDGSRHQQHRQSEEGRGHPLTYTHSCIWWQRMCSQTQSAFLISPQLLPDALKPCREGCCVCWLQVEVGHIYIQGSLLYTPVNMVRTVRILLKGSMSIWLAEISFI